MKHHHHMTFFVLQCPDDESCPEDRPERPRCDKPDCPHNNHEPRPRDEVFRPYPTEANIPCPTCGALPAEPCFDLIRAGRVNRYPHKDRPVSSMRHTSPPIFPAEPTYPHIQQAADIINQGLDERGIPRL